MSIACSSSEAFNWIGKLRRVNEREINLSPRACSAKIKERLGPSPAISPWFMEIP